MKLYKKDTKWKIRVLEIFSDGKYLRRESGLLDGKSTLHAKECKWKNIWKKNETTPEQQAVLEREALIEKKLREWYFKTLAEAKKEEVILPMLAKEYDKEKHKIDWSKPVFVQPKLDWIRCLAIIKDSKVKLISRKGVVINTMPHIEKDLKIATKWLNDIILDGELYAHGKTFQENMSLIKKYREWESEEIKFHIYDSISEKQFLKRKAEANHIWTRMNLRKVPTHAIKTISQIRKEHDYCVSKWYEGLMIRHGDDGYKVNWRSSSLLKYKDFIDETFEIVRIEPMETYVDQGLVVCRNKDGIEFKATPKMSHEARRELLTNASSYVGATAEVRFFEYTDDWVPRFPIFYWVRLDK